MPVLDLLWNERVSSYFASSLVDDLLLRCAVELGRERRIRLRKLSARLRQRQWKRAYEAAIAAYDGGLNDPYIDTRLDLVVELALALHEAQQLDE